MPQKCPADNWTRIIAVMWHFWATRISLYCRVWLTYHCCIIYAILPYVVLCCTIMYCVVSLSLLVSLYLVVLYYVMSCHVFLSSNVLLCQIVLYFVTLHYTAACRVALSPLTLHQWCIRTVLPPLTVGDIFALERLKAAGVNQLSKGTWVLSAYSLIASLSSVLIPLQFRHSHFLH